MTALFAGSQSLDAREKSVNQTGGNPGADFSIKRPQAELD
jgi:hypothetical protein